MSSATATLSPLATGPTALATMGGTVDYFGVANYANSPLPTVSNGAVTGGVRKFVDTLPGICGVSPWGIQGANGLGQCIPLAQPIASTTFQGSDYYQIGLSEYTTQLHPDLPATKLRGYVDLNARTPVHQYLGPLILATRNRPVRVLFTNQIAANMPIPVDGTYMGAGMVNDGTRSVMASEKRATLHLHGGNTPWISDGTTHQWITPSGGDGQPAVFGFAKGFSFQNVPDMVGAGKPIAAPSLTDGKGTFYWTNQQSGRLMFYHDHAYGITRLNVYAGEAAGYLLVDPVQENALAAATVPGTIGTSRDLAHLVPLVIQDKTFVPDSGVAGGQLAATDPTWDVANWGAGSLWFPHVYMPNQNPADVSGANAYGRWDYGAWFWPPQNPGTYVSQPYQCTSAATPAGGWAFPPLMCPGTPLPSGVPEGFMDTPIVNGTAYPRLDVDPAAYRFQVLNAANDRTLNLGLYVAEPLTISLASGGAGYTTVPNVNITGGGGTGATATATLDASGAVASLTLTNAGSGYTAAPTVAIDPPACTPDPLNPQLCAPAVAVASVNTEVKMLPAVPANARSVPDCTTPNPMGSEGLALALLDGNGNPINNTGLPGGCWPTYFSTIAGNLIWPTDARDGGVPDPATAGPPIIQIGTEGGLLPKPVVIPSTPISYDYNKRSITVLNVLNHGLYMGPAERADIIIDFSAFAGKTLIVYNDAPAPVPAGDPRNDYYTNGPDNSPTGGAPSTLAGYGPNTRTIMQIVVGNTPVSSSFKLASLSTALPGIFASTQDTIIVPETAYPSSNGGASADTYVRIQDTSMTAWTGGAVGGLTLTSGGAGYNAAPAVTIDPPRSPCPTGLACTPATAAASLAPTSVASVTLTNGGSGYTSVPTVTISNGATTTATATATLAPTSVGSLSLTNGGKGYTTAPTVTISAPQTVGGTTATATATVSKGKVTALTLTNAGTGYTAAPTVNLTGGGGTSATATAALAPAPVGALTLTNGGSGYTAAPTVTISGGGGSNAAGIATLTPTVVASISLTNAGSGYTFPPNVTLSAPQTAGSTATAKATAPVTPMLPKTIQELFTLDYGRMNATLGVELPFTNFLTQTTIPYGYVDPPTELFKDGETQIWKVTHNGVDTHFIHFHLFNVQVINRVGWDGAIKPPDPDELSWKDTVRMNPLEDVVVALRPLRQTLPWDLPNSIRPMDVTMPVNVPAMANQFTDIDPTNQPAAVTNTAVNFGWEYVWHCHILGHEENDMMRAMAMAVPPQTPPPPSATLNGTTSNPRVTLAWTDNSINETGFTIQRAARSSGPWTTVGTVASTTGPAMGGTVTFTDATVTRRSTYVYRVIANNVIGYTQTYAAPAAGYPSTSADSAPSPASSPVTTQ